MTVNGFHFMSRSLLARCTSWGAIQSFMTVNGFHFMGRTFGTLHFMGWHSMFHDSQHKEAVHLLTSSQFFLSSCRTNGSWEVVGEMEGSIQERDKKNQHETLKLRGL